MATCFATLTYTAQCIPLDFDFPFPASHHCDFNFVPKATGMKPISAGAFNLQYLLDNFGPEKSGDEDESIYRV